MDSLRDFSSAVLASVSSATASGDMLESCLRVAENGFSSNEN